MSMREIKNAVNNTTGELIYFKGHAKATFMSDGSTVEDVIKNIKPNIDLSDYVKSEELEGYAKTEDIPSLEGYAKSDEIPSLDGYAKTEDIPSLDGYAKTSELPNFNEFAKIDDIPSLDGYAKEEDIPPLYGYATQQWVNDQEFAHQDDLLNMSFNDIQDIPITENNDGEVNIVDDKGNIALKVNKEGLYVKDVIAGEHVLSNKADTSYVDEAIAQIVDGAPETLDTLNELSAALKDNADIVDVLNQSISSKQDIIPDLETIRQGAAKGATALQSYQTIATGSTNGTIKVGDTDVMVKGLDNLMTINNNSIFGGGNIDLASSSQIRDLQPLLVSGTNIKTINNTSLLGSGNITTPNAKNLTYILNNATTGGVTLQPNACIYMPNPLTANSKFQINACETYSTNGSELIESRICFRMPDSGTLPTITFSGVAIRWAGGVAPTFEADFTYEISLFYPSNVGSVGPMGVCVGFK